MKRSGGVLGAVLTLLVACSGSDDGNVGEEAKKAQEAFATEYCTVITPCCDKVSLPRDVAGCAAQIALLDPVAVKDEKARAACTAQLKTISSLPDLCTDFKNIDQPACPDPDRPKENGSKKVGEACAKDTECAQTFDGIVTCKGVCTITKRGKDGDGPCIATVDGKIEMPVEGATGSTLYRCHVRDGVLCEAKSKTCKKPGDVGAPCIDHDGCTKAAFCDKNTTKCATRKSTGAACSGDDRECKEGAFCDSGFCAAATAEGTPCKTGASCTTGICNGGKCEKPPNDKRLVAVCTPPPPSTSK